MKYAQLAHTNTNWGTRHVYSCWPIAHIELFSLTRSSDIIKRGSCCTYALFVIWVFQKATRVLARSLIILSSLQKIISSIGPSLLPSVAGHNERGFGLSISTRSRILSQLLHPSPSISSQTVLCVALHFYTNMFSYKHWPIHKASLMALNNYQKLICWILLPHALL